MKQVIIPALAITALVSVSIAANAACSPVVTTITDGVSIDVAGCHLQIHNPPIIPISVSPIIPGGSAPGSSGIELVVRETSSGEIGSDGGVIVDTINQNTYLIANAVASQSVSIADHETRITANTNKNIQQDNRLDGHDTAIGSLETLTADHTTRLNAHDALLSQHAATLDEHGKGLAISMAMPDAWLSDSKSFGVFGSVGGFGDETALGFAAIGRIDQTWSLNAKLGADTDFDQVGWQAGFGAQW